MATSLGASARSGHRPPPTIRPANDPGAAVVLHLRVGTVERGTAVTTFVDEGLIGDVIVRPKRPGVSREDRRRRPADGAGFRAAAAGRLLSGGDRAPTAL
jgi:hypothetical protein